ncbi:unnamed protein product [Haemonchus placei]|uniref:Uncharacterized protein n=1 Tax=Haemonchus placei TaxID=6290 RepID=A0A0N4X3X2_HAEPC|nr:unnamed protein product [Haemonchus placei]
MLQNDISGRAHSLPNSLTRRNSKKTSSTHGPCGGLPMLRTSRSIEYHRGDGNFNTRTVTSPTYDYNSDSGSESGKIVTHWTPNTTMWDTRNTFAMSAFDAFEEVMEC